VPANEVADYLVAPEAEPAVAAPGVPAPAQVGKSASAESDWHFMVAPYLWLPWVYGTIGANGHDAHFYATPGDLLSHFRFGLLGVVEPDYKRIVMPVDILWMRFFDGKALPITGNEVSANVKLNMFILTPKIGYRLIDLKAIKIDALTGFRYWHIGESVKFNPSMTGFNFSRSQNWVDPLVGGRILGNLSPKVEIAIGGDVGGWGTGSQLDYQVFGALGYRIKRAVALQAGYRYLFVNYRNGTRIVEPAISGPLFGATITLK
jgi:hypothetical protein